MACEHVRHEPPELARLCAATRRARVWTSPYFSDPRVRALLALVVRGHEAGASRDAPRIERAAEAIERALCELEGPKGRR